MSAPGQLMGPGASSQSDVIEIPGRWISLLFKVMKLEHVFVVWMMLAKRQFEMHSIRHDIRITTFSSGKDIG